jgi:hypothetical protein
LKPDEIIALVERAVRQGLTSSLWLVVVVSTVGAGVGAFLGAYLKKKAELRAAKEEFDESLRQVQAQTRAVESIKSDLSKDLEAYRAKITQEVTRMGAEIQDQLKRESEFVAFRYKKIFEVFEDLAKLPAIDYTYLKSEVGTLVPDRELFKQVVTQTTERHSAVSNLLARVRPLLDEKFALEIKSAFLEAELQSNLITEAIYTGRELPQGIDVVTLTQAREAAELSAKRILGMQIAAMTKGWTQTE